MWITLNVNDHWYLILYGTEAFCYKYHFFLIFTSRSITGGLKYRYKVDILSSQTFSIQFFNLQNIVIYNKMFSKPSFLRNPIFTFCIFDFKCNTYWTYLMYLNCNCVPTYIIVGLEVFSNPNEFFSSRLHKDKLIRFIFTAP